MPHKLKLTTFLIVTLFLGCNTGSDGDPTVSDCYKVEIYCNCMSYSPPVNAGEDISISNFNICKFTAGIPPSSLITTRSFFESTIDTSRINALKNVIFNGRNTEEKISDWPDSRFLILFRKNDSSNDTVVWRYPNQICYNGYKKFNYSFNVLDSVRKILGKEGIYCISGR